MLSVVFHDYRRNKRTAVGSKAIDIELDRMVMNKGEQIWQRRRTTDSGRQGEKPTYIVIVIIVIIVLWYFVLLRKSDIGTELHDLGLEAYLWVMISDSLHIICNFIIFYTL